MGIALRMMVAVVWRARKTIVAVPMFVKARAYVFYGRGAAGAAAWQTAKLLCGAANKELVVSRRLRGRPVWFAITTIAPVRSGVSGVEHVPRLVVNALWLDLPIAQIPVYVVSMGTVL
jgi:hypothetical protein